jgi:hypothetical protein
MTFPAATPAAVPSGDFVESELSTFLYPGFPSLPSFQAVLGLAVPMKAFIIALSFWPFALADLP